MLSRKLILVHAHFKLRYVSHLAIHAWHFIGTPSLKIAEICRYRGQRNGAPLAIKSSENLALIDSRIMPP
jgi:hypothetical protein